MEDNTYTDGLVAVTIPGDVDGDFDVDIYDVVKICAIYGKKHGDPNYNPSCDIDNDVVICTNHYGHKDP